MLPAFRPADTEGQSDIQGHRNEDSPDDWGSVTEFAGQTEDPNQKTRHVFSGALRSPAHQNTKFHPF